MEVKKARRADLEKGKSRWLFMGLIVTLSFMFVSFEWTERNVTYAISDLVSDPDFFEELVPVTYNQDKPLPPPPPPAAVNPEELNIVDNNSTETETDIAASDPTDAPVIIPTPIEVPEEVVDENVEFVVVEEMPVFRNGNADLMRYLSENIKYPTVSAEQGVQGRDREISVIDKRCTNPRCITAREEYLPNRSYLKLGMQMCDYCDKRID